MVLRDLRECLAEIFGGQSHTDDLEFTHPIDPKASDGRSR